MTRWLMLFIAFAAFVAAQESGGQSTAPAPTPEGGQLKKERPQPAQTEDYEAPREEDEAMGVREYSFNPLQSEKEVRVGNYYFKQRNYRAAAGRYREALKWNERNAGAWLRLAEAAERTKDVQSARDAYGRYLELDPNAKNATSIRKKMSKLK